MFLSFLVIEVVSGHLSGFQKRIMDKNTQVVFVSCDNLYFKYGWRAL